MSVKSDNPNIKSIKHMAFAVRDAKEALSAYSKFLHVPTDTQIIDYPKSKNRVALFNLGGIEYQLCQSLEEGGRFDAWIKQRNAQGLHHICYEVENIDAALDHAKSQGAVDRLVHQFRRLAAELHGGVALDLDLSA